MDTHDALANIAEQLVTFPEHRWNLVTPDGRRLIVNPARVIAITESREDPGHCAVLVCDRGVELWATWESLRALPGNLWPD